MDNHEPLTPAELAELKRVVGGMSEPPWRLAVQPVTSATLNHEPFAYWIIDAGPRAVHWDKATYIHADDMVGIGALRNSASRLIQMARRWAYVRDHSEDFVDEYWRSIHSGGAIATAIDDWSVEKAVDAAIQEAT